MSTTCKKIYILHLLIIIQYNTIQYIDFMICTLIDIIEMFLVELLLLIVLSAAYECSFGDLGGCDSAATW